VTPAQMARAECAEWTAGGCRSTTPCKLRVGRRCQYFEDFVLPMAVYTTDPDKSKAYLDAVADYKSQHNIAGAQRRCPECGEPLPARRRFCADCTSKHRRKSTRDAVRRIRGSACKQLTEINPRKP